MPTLDSRRDAAQKRTIFKQKLLLGFKVVDTIEIVKNEWYEDWAVALVVGHNCMMIPGTKGRETPKLVLIQFKPSSSRVEKIMVFSHLSLPTTSSPSVEKHARRIPQNP